MSGRILTERLLATSSLAALLLATVGTQDAQAVVCTSVPAGGAYSNSGSIPCVAVTTDAVSVTNTSTGTIGNSNSLTAVSVFNNVTLSGGVINAGTISTSGTGAGLGAIVDTGVIIGGITNSGTITMLAGQGNCNGAVKIDGSSLSFLGGITNSGTIAASLSGVSLSRGCVEALGIRSSLFTGNVTNSGTIAAAAVATAATATVNAIAINMVVTAFTGSILNSGTITASVHANQCACATGLYLDASLVTGGFSNTGTIAATGISSGSSAQARGVSFGVRTMIGGITNSGTISAIATASDSALAEGLTTYQNNNTTQILGGFLNSGTGTISAVATSTSDNATAHGVVLGAYSSSDTVLFAGGVSNGGTIIATAQGIDALAVGLDITLSAYHPTGSSVVASLSGGVVNSGTIIATATATSGTVTATAAHLTVYGFSTNNATFGILSGNVVNTGKILASASTTGNANALASGLTAYVGQMNGDFSNSGTIAGSAIASHANATAFGAQLTIYSAIGNFSNTGTISATATAGAGNANATGFLLSNYNGQVGSFSNGGTISGTAIATNGDANATGAAININIYHTGIGLTGDFVNSGTIRASATATATGGGTADAFASGLSLGVVGTMVGNVTNSGIVSATAIQQGAVGSGCAQAIAMSFYASTMFGNFSNSGTIAASALAQGSSATATGLSLTFETMIGAIVNSGTISASATGSSGLARGVDFSTTSFAGNFSNSGTISASFTATNGGSGAATAIRFNATSFSGTLTNSGTISASRTGNGTAIGIHVFGLQSGTATIANSGTISATDIAIDLNSNVPVTINQTAGLITGATAIAFSSHGDTLNASGGQISGKLVGQSAGTMINVAAGAGGTFTFAGTTTNIGTIRVNSGTLLLATQSNGAGSVVNTANFTQAAGGTLGIAVSPTVHASVNATNLTLGGPLVIYENPATWAPGTTYTYTNALTWTSLTGAFTSVGSNSPLFSASVTQSGSSDTITLGLLPASQIPGITPNNQNVLQAAENAGLTPIYTLTNTSQLNTLLTSLSGQQNTQTFQSNVNAWNQFTSMLIDRLFGGGGTGPTGVASFTKGQGLQFAQADIPQVAQASDAARPGVAPVPQSTPWGVWARGYGSWASAPSTASSASYDESGAGVILGGDAQIGDRAVAGFAFNIGTDNVDISGGAHNDINTYQGAFYGKYAVDPHLYVAGLAGFGWQDYDARRFIMAPFSANATSNYSGQGYRLYGESGYAFHLAGPVPDTTVTPYLGLGYLHTHVDGFTEAGGGGAALTVGAVDANSFTTTLGARASTAFRVGNTVLKPELRVAWQHEWLDDSTNVQSAFASAPGSVFTVTGASFGRDSFIGGTGISTTLAGFGVSDPRFAPTQLFIDYDVRANGGYLANVVSGGLRVQF